jgi:hypothetical protein
VIDQSSTLPLLAIVLSVASFVLSVLNYLRDRPSVKVWSQIEYHARGSTPDAQTPALRIRVANLGRRPAVLLNLVSRSGGMCWSQRLTNPNTGKASPLSVEETVRLIDKHSLAQNSAVRLLEGDVLDLVFWPDDCTDFMHWETEPARTAEKLFIEDCTGKRHRVKGDAKNLAVFFQRGDPR